MQGRWWALAVSCAGLMIQHVGCNGQLSPEAQRLLSSGRQAYDRGDVAEAVRQMDVFLREYGGTRGAGRAYYVRGLSKIRLKDTDGAKADLMSAVARAHEEQLRGEALVPLGDMAFDAGDMALAENQYRQALAAVDTKKPPADHARYRLGCVLQRQARWPEADAQFNKIHYDFPGSAAAKSVGRRVHRRAWTVQVGAFHDKQSAEAMVKRLLADGLSSARSEPNQLEGKAWFLVQVGRYATYEQAAAALPDVRQQYEDAFVTVTW